MPAEYINRRKEKYYVKAIPTKAGKQRFYIVKGTTKTNPDDLLQEIPSGFEFCGRQKFKIIARTNKR